MIPALDRIRAVCPGLDERFLREHVSRLNEAYFGRFPEEDICRHAVGLSMLSSMDPVQAVAKVLRDGSVDVTVLAFDYPFEFSIITGLLAGMGLSVLSGDIFTYRHAPPAGDAGSRRGLRARAAQDPLRRRRIIDHFTGRLDTAISFKSWAGQLKENLAQIIGLLEQGDEGSVLEARHRVNDMVVRRLAQAGAGGTTALFPVRIHVNNADERYTRLRVVSEDTPAFLYSLSNALSLNRVHIEHVQIRTIGSRVEDRIDLVDASGRKITDPDVLDRVRLSVLLTKQFTYFLAKAPDPHAALSRFEHLVRDVLELPEKGRWLDLLTNPHALRDLARILGTSDFLWEDFIRLQYESLLPMLEPHVRGRRFSEGVDALQEKLDASLRGLTTLEERKRALNQFKDREIFLIDLDHILYPEPGYRAFSEKLSALAEMVVNAATRIVYDDLVRRYGTPRAVAGIEARLAVMALGKLGGKALGYASDIEVLFVYSDNGETDGREPLTNLEFFDRLVRGVIQFVEAKKEGIFHLDLRLRPFGSAGPLASSLENFCRYYGPGGGAKAYERLALVRMRAIGGDIVFGSRLERLRDEMVYAGRSIDFEEIRQLREKQFAEKKQGGRWNAKFGAGGLVDLEYGVQSLQVMYGKDRPSLRTPRLHEALEALTASDILDPGEALRMVSAYEFLRLLINGMRMLRGSADDLFLPDPQSDEFDHLARRIGYEQAGGLDPGQQLRIDFENHTAAVRAFVERRFGRDRLPDPNSGSVVDLIISESLPDDLIERVLTAAGFRNPRRAYGNLRRLAGDGEQRRAFARLAVLAFEILSASPDPDMALNNWERFVHASLSAEFHYGLSLSQPMRLEILLGVFSVSQFMADTLIRNPGFLDWVILPEILHKERKGEDLIVELRRAAAPGRSRGEWLNELRRFRRREILRIGTRDICLGVDTEEVMRELSLLADSTALVVLERIWRDFEEKGGLPGPAEQLRSRFCVMALGKLGGGELNYSSDIDLLGLYLDEERPAPASRMGACKEIYTRIMESVRSDLSTHTEEGYAYRVDLRLRPFGASGDLVPSVRGLLNYYSQKASLWEIQAALKMRPVAGNLALGYGFLEQLRPVLVKRRKKDSVARSIETMRSTAMKAASREMSGGTDVKSGFGGIRDVEFLVQGLQIIHAPDSPMLLEGNTLAALDALSQWGIVPGPAAEQLKEDYIFLRRIEHFLQILEDQQIHALPADRAELDALSKKMMGVGADGASFLEGLKARLQRVHEMYETYLLGEGGGVY